MGRAIEANPRSGHAKGRRWIALGVLGAVLIAFFGIRSTMSRMRQARVLEEIRIYAHALKLPWAESPMTYAGLGQGAHDENVFVEGVYCKFSMDPQTNKILRADLGFVPMGRTTTTDVTKFRELTGRWAAYSGFYKVDRWDQALSQAGELQYVDMIAYGKASGSGKAHGVLCHFSSDGELLMCRLIY